MTDIQTAETTMTARLMFMKLTCPRLSLLTHALHIAAAEYAVDHQVHAMSGRKECAEQFKSQCHDAHTLADEIDRAVEQAVRKRAQPNKELTEHERNTLAHAVRVLQAVITEIEIVSPGDRVRLEIAQSH
jgi:hypothetical protein